MFWNDKPPAKAASDADAADGLRVWMDDAEWSQLLAVMFTLQPRHGLEWGSGGSTRALLAACPFIERWVSVEHHRPWYQRVRASIDDPRLSLHHAPPDVAMPTDDADEQAHVAWNASAEQDVSVLQSYVAWPATLGLVFDLVLVDGRARCHCIPEGFRLLRPGGVLVLHDAQRPAYHAALHACGTPHFLKPFSQGQIALLRKPDGGA